MGNCPVTPAAPQGASRQGWDDRHRVNGTCFPSSGGLFQPGQLQGCRIQQSPCSF